MNNQLITPWDKVPDIRDRIVRYDDSNKASADALALAANDLGYSVSVYQDTDLNWCTLLRQIPDIVYDDLLRSEPGLPPHPIVKKE